MTFLHFLWTDGSSLKTTIHGMVDAQSYSSWQMCTWKFPRDFDFRWNVHLEAHEKFMLLFDYVDKRNKI